MSVVSQRVFRDGSSIQLPQQVVSGIGALAGGGVWVAGFLASVLPLSPVFVILCLPIALYLLFSLKVADQWQKVAVLRLGKYQGLRGPGLFHIIPVIDTMSKFVD